MSKWLHCFLSFLSGFISNLTIQRQHFPTDEDQTGAAKALLRLQDTYRLDANTISTGDLPGKSICVFEDIQNFKKPNRLCVIVV